MFMNARRRNSRWRNAADGSEHDPLTGRSRVNSFGEKAAIDHEPGNEIGMAEVLVKVS